MPSFQYSAINQTGSVVRGRIDASNRQDLERRISDWDFRLSVAVRLAIVLGGGLSIFQRSISRDELAQFCFYVERLVSGGVPLLEGLSDVRDSVSNPALRNTIGILIQDIEQGTTISQAMKQHPKIFDEIFISLVEAGEQSGELDRVLKNIGDISNGRMKSSKKRKKLSVIRCLPLLLCWAPLGFADFGCPSNGANFTIFGW